VARPWIIGHRGASAFAPENTMAAFERAFQAGADGIELDVTLSSEGVPVVIHDDTLMRTAGADGWVWKRSVFELKSLDAGSWFGAGFASEKIPTLAEVLELARGRGVVNVEIKSSRESARNAGPSPKALARAVTRVIETHADPESIVVSSFDPRVLRRVRKLAPALKRGFLRSSRQVRPWTPFAMWACPDYVHPDVALVDEAARWIGGYEKLLVWTVDGSFEQERLASAGVKAIITNRPAEALARLRP
jgi:glycerophosphoryl diester phosphodiesterase